MRSRHDLGASCVAVCLFDPEAGVGGRRGRKVVFQVDDGSAWVRTL